jgi:hypothetical protein
LLIRNHHYPSQKLAVLSTLVWWARDICDFESVDREIECLKKNFGQNGYSKVGS